MIFRAILKRIDYLAPSIGLHYNGSGKHYSKVSHTISLISFIGTILSIIYFIRPFILKKNPSTVINEKLVKVAEPIYIKPSSFFHLIHIFDMGNLFSDFDFTSFRVIGIEEDIIIYKEHVFLEEINHWVYGPCDPNIDFVNGKDLDDYKDMEILFNKSVCIKKYFNTEAQEYYNVNSKGFKWPVIKGGILNQNVNKEYTIIIEKCQQDTLELIMGEGSTCKSESEIYEKIDQGSLVASLYFIDYYIDLDDYDDPNKKYLTDIYDYIDNDFYTINDITLSHLTLKTTKGILFNGSKKKNIYDYDDSEKTLIHHNNNTNIYNAFSFQLNNIKKIYIRKYKNLIDIFSNIGGFSKIIKIIARILIKYYNQYNVLYDTKELISNLYNDDKKEKYKRRKINLNNTKIDNIDINQTFSKLKPPGDNINNDNNNSIKDNNLNSINYNNMEKTNDSLKNNFLNNIYNNYINKTNNNINYNENTNKNLNIDYLINSKNKNQNNNEFKTNINNNQYPENYLKEREDNFNQENLKAKYEKTIDEKSNKNSEETSSYFVEKNKQFSYCSYVAHKLSCKKKYTFYKIYGKFRTHILSEEQIIKNHIITYNLVKKEDISVDRQIYSLKEIIDAF